MLLRVLEILHTKTNIVVLVVLITQTYVETAMKIQRYCNYMDTTVKPQNEYCYAYDDSAGTLIIKHNYIVITFWNAK